MENNLQMVDANQSCDHIKFHNVESNRIESNRIESNRIESNLNEPFFFRILSDNFSELSVTAAVFRMIVGKGWCACALAHARHLTKVVAVGCRC